MSGPYVGYLKNQNGKSRKSSETKDYKKIGVSGPCSKLRLK